MYQEIANRMASDIISHKISGEDFTGISWNHYMGMVDTCKALGIDITYTFDENHSPIAITVGGCTAECR